MKTNKYNIYDKVEVIRGFLKGRMGKIDRISITIGGTIMYHIIFMGHDSPGYAVEFSEDTLEIIDE